MKNSSIRFLLFVCLCLLFSGATLASAAQGSGGSGRGGGNGGGGGGTTGQAAGALYGDLYVLERDGKGAPINRNVTYTDPTTGGQVTVSCVQPISKPTCTPNVTGATALPICSLLPLNGEKTDFNPEVDDPCAVQAAYTDCLQAVSFGRESVARASTAVIDMSYGEALGRINSAAANRCSCDYQANFCNAGLDTRATKRNPAGLLELCVPLEDGSGYNWTTMDAPLENLGLYRTVMTSGCLGKVTEEKTGEEGVRVTVTTALDPTGIFYLNSSGFGYLVCPYNTAVPATETAALSQEAACQVTPDVVGGTADAPCWWESPGTPAAVTSQDMLSSAAFIAAGADKTSPITLDEIINVNTYLGINPWTYTRSKNTQILNVTYFPFEYPAGTWYTYTRGTDAATANTQAFVLAGGPATFTAQYISLFNDSANGVKLENVSVCRGGALMSAPADSICDAATDAAYTTSPAPNGCGGANWFTQAAEDARKVIWYMHNWAVPVVAY